MPTIAIQTAPVASSKSSGTVKSSAERQREFRQRKLEALGQEGYREYMRIQKAATRAKARAKAAEEAPTAPAAEAPTAAEAPVATKKTAKKTAKTTKNIAVDDDKPALADRVYKPSTKAIYEKALDAMHRKMYKKERNGLEWTRDVEGVLAKINETWSNTTTRWMYVNRIASVIGREKGFSKEHAKYSEVNKAGSLEYNTRRKDNVVSERDKGKMVSWEKLQEGIKDAKDAEAASQYAVYTMIPPRRLEYRTVRIAEPDSDLSTGNWLVLKQKGVPDKFVFNDYKTSDRYGTQEVHVSKALAVHLKTYLMSSKRKAGSLLWVNADGNPYSAQRWSSRIIKVMNDVHKKPVSVVRIRQAASSWLHQQPWSVNQKEAYANKMGHSMETSMQYNKLKIDD
jgi:hypothetical protein